MKQLAIVFGLLFFSLGKAQTTNLLKGKVMCDTLAVSGIEVINSPYAKKHISNSIMQL